MKRLQMKKESLDVDHARRWRTISFGGSFVVSIISLAVICLSMACERQPVPHQVVGANIPVAKVALWPVEESEIVDNELIMGTIVPRMRATLSAKITGRVEKVNVTSGSHVESGAVLLEIEAEDLRARVAQAEAVYKQSQVELGRYAKLAKQQAASEQAFETAQSAERVAKAQLEGAQTMLSYSVIRAPFTGVVSFKYVDVGDSAAPSVRLLEVVTAGELQVAAEVPETLFNRVKLGDALRIKVSHDRYISGQVSEIVPTSDAVSRTFAVKLDIKGDAGVQIGQFVRVELPLGPRKLVIVPEGVVVKRGQMDVVFVVENGIEIGIAKLRLVRTGREMDKFGEHGGVEVLAGLEPAEVVVSAGLERLQDGQKIAVE